MAFVLLAITSHAQTQGKATIQGRISDSTGASIPFSTVIIKEIPNIGATADEKGWFVLENIPFGNYTIIVQSVGFKSQTHTIRITDNSTVVKNFRLKEEVNNLNEVVVSGKKKTESEKLKESEFNVNAIETEQYKNTTADLNQVLNRSTGVKVREQGGVGSDFNFAINGLSGKSVRFFIDGIPMDLMGTSMSLNNIPVNLAERVEVYKGVLPVYLGADALGGAVNVITNQKMVNYLDASYGVASFNTHKAALTGQYSFNKTGIVLRASAFYNFSKNNYIMKGMEVWNADAERYENKDLRRFHDDYQSAMTQVEVGVKNKKWADVFFVGGGFTLFNQDIQTGNNQMAVYGKADRLGDAYSATIRYRKDTLFIKGLNLNIFASNSRDKYTVYDTTNLRYYWDQSSILTNSAELGRTKSINHIIRPRNYARANLSYEINDHHSLNLNYTIDNISNRTYNELIVDKDYNPGQITKHIVGLAYQQNFFRKKLTNTYFAKYYGMALKQPQVILTTGEIYSSSDWFNNYAYGIGLRYRLTRSLGIKASFEKAYRLQEVGEMFGNGFNQISNLNLKPENSDNYNLGFFANLNLANHFVSFDAAAFYRNARDFIHAVTYLSNSQVSQYQNTSNVLIKGVEADAKYTYRDWLSIFVNGSYQNAVNNTKYSLGHNSGTIEGTFLSKIPNQPWFFGNAGIGFSRKNIFKEGDKMYLNWDIQYTHWFYLTWESLGDPTSKDLIPDQYIQNVSLSYSVKNGMYNISAECRNLTDALAYDNFRLQKPGRLFAIKLRVFLERI